MLGFIEPLNDASEICNVADLAKLVKTFDSLEDIVKKSKLKDLDTLMNEQDLMARYHWAYLEMQVKKLPLPDIFDFGIVKERHYTLNWLLTDMFGEDWDDIDTPA